MYQSFVAHSVTVSVHVAHPHCLFANIDTKTHPNSSHPTNDVIGQVRTPVHK
jgi:hypothetical protein